MDLLLVTLQEWFKHNIFLMKNLHSKVSYDLILKPLSFYEKRFGRV